MSTASRPTTPAPAFRGDIEGLRGIAVALVVLFHVRSTLLPGGFVGVDVFMVISGYVITALLLRDMAAGRYRFVTFLERRIRRIFPAAATMLAAASLAAWQLLLPSDMANFGSAAASAAVFLSNLHFEKAAGYFVGLPSPLLHTWSVSVEVQFYLLYPGFLYAVRRRPAPWLLAAAGLSLAIWIVAMNRSSNFAFYQIPARGWEFLAGAIIAAKAPRPTRWLDGIGIAGLALILGTAALCGPRTPLPGLAVLLGCAGSVMVICAGEQWSSPVSRLLAWRPIRGLGAVSYSLYLWHWPILAFWIYRTARLITTGEALFLMSLSLVLAVVSWRFVEQPFRERRYIPDRRGLLVTATLVPMLLAAWSLETATTGGWPQRVPPLTRIFDGFRASRFAGTAACPFDGAAMERRAATGAYCQLGAPSVAPDWALWGDSHAIALTVSLAEALAARGHSLREFTLFGCPPVPGLDTNWRETPLCIAHNDRVLAAILATPAIRNVVMLGYYSEYLPRTGRQPLDTPNANFASTFRDRNGHLLSEAQAETQLGEDLQRTIAALTAAGRTVYLYDPIPSAAYNIPKHLAISAWRSGGADPAEITRTNYLERNRGVFAAFTGLHALPPGRLKRIDLWQVLCASETCPTHAGAVSYYRDESHPSLPGATRIVAPLLGDITSPADQR